jgi:hypothetical protein
MSWLVPLLLLTACKTKNVEPAAPIVGWHQEEGWQGACYFPPNWEEMGSGDRRMERQNTLQAMMSQWRGDRGDGVSFDPKAIENTETVLLGSPDKTEQVAEENIAACQEAMRSGKTSGWGAWLVALPGRLTEGECRRPFDYTLYDYLDIGRDWQIPVSVCKENRVRITGSAIDFYRVADRGPWINVAGDADQPARGADYPCTLEGCLVGQLIMRFTGDSGLVTVLPVGEERIYEVPEHGKIEVMINDTSYFDNIFKIEGGMQHHTSIEYYPLGL